MGTGSFRTTFIFFLLSVCGLFTISKLNFNPLPSQENKQLYVSFSLPNSTPEVVEQQVTAILEGAFSKVSELKKITSSSGYNNGRIELHFDEHSNIEFKHLEISSIIRQILPKLPSSLSVPVISYSNESQDPLLLVYSFNAALEPVKIKKEVESFLQKTVSKIISKNNISYNETGKIKIKIKYNSRLCQSLGISTSEISGTLNNYTYIDYPGLFKRDPKELLFIKTKSSLNDLNDLKNIVFKTAKGNTVYLKDFASVYFEEIKPDYYLRINGKNTVSISFSSQQEQNDVQLAARIKKALVRSKKDLPEGFEMHLDYDNTDSVNILLNKNLNRLFISMALILTFSLFNYRNLKYTGVLFASSILHIAISSLLCFLFNLKIQENAFVGFIFSLGVVFSNIQVMIIQYQKNNRKWTSVTNIIPGIILIVMSYIFFYFSLKEYNDTAFDFTMVAIISIISSILVNNFFIRNIHGLFKPGILSDGSIKNKTTRVFSIYSFLINKLSRYKPLVVFISIMTFGLPFFLLPKRLKGDTWFVVMYNKTIGSKDFQRETLPFINKYIGGSVSHFVSSIENYDDHSIQEKTLLRVDADLPEGAPAELTNNLILFFENYLQTLEPVEKFVSAVSNNHGSIEISFKKDKDKLAISVQDEMIALSGRFGGVKWNISGVGNGFNSQANTTPQYLKIFIKGYNYDELEKQAKNIESELSKNSRIKNINVNTNQYGISKDNSEYSLHVSSIKIARKGIASSEIFTYLSDLGEKSDNGNLHLNNGNFPVIISEQNSSEFDNYKMLYDPIILTNSKQIRLSEVGYVKQQQLANSIYKEDRQYIRAITFEYIGTIRYGTLFLNEFVASYKTQMPVGYTASTKSNTNLNKKVSSYLTLILLFVFVIFILSSIHYESLRIPFTVLLIVFVSSIGFFLPFLVSELPFEFESRCGIFISCGLTVGLIAFLLNDYKFINKQKQPAASNKLLIELFKKKFKLIFSLIVSISCGFLSLVIIVDLNSFWLSIALGSLGQLLFSIIPIFLVLPAILWKK